MENKPLFPISSISELLKIHPQTLRVWEKHGVINPQRRSGRRFYSLNDLKKLKFIQYLIKNGLTLPSIKFHLRLYPCWQDGICLVAQHINRDCLKPCWKDVANQDNI